jgi:hypothetical protein
MSEPNNPDAVEPEAVDTTPGAPATPMPQVLQSEEAIRASTQEPAISYAAPQAAPKSGWRSRLGLGAAALGLLAAGALGGLALSHAVGEGDGRGQEQFGERHDGDFDRDGDHGPGQIQPGQIQPGQIPPGQPLPGQDDDR